MKWQPDRKFLVRAAVILAFVVLHETHTLAGSDIPGLLDAAGAVEKALDPGS